MQELELTEKLLKEIEYIEKLQEAEEFDVEKFTASCKICRDGNGQREI